MTPERTAELRRVAAVYEHRPCHAGLREALDEVERLQHAEAILRKLLRSDTYGGRSVIWSDSEFIAVLSHDVDREYPITPDEAGYLRTLGAGS